MKPRTTSPARRVLLSVDGLRPALYRALECRHPFPNLLAHEKARASAEAVESIYLLPLGLADIPVLCYVF